MLLVIPWNWPPPPSFPHLTVPCWQLWVVSNPVATQEGVCVFLSPFFAPFFSHSLCPLSPDVSPAKEDKESELWKMLHEPEEQAAGGEEAQAGVRMASQLPL